MNSFTPETTQFAAAGDPAGSAERIVIPVLAEQAQVHLQREHTGTVRVRYEYRLGTRASDGFFDPSIADLWVLPVGADTQAPDLSGTISTGTVGANGWYRSAVEVAVAAVDNRDASPVVEVEHLGLVGPEGPVFTDVSLAVLPARATLLVDDRRRRRRWLRRGRRCP